MFKSYAVVCLLFSLRLLLLTDVKNKDRMRSFDLFSSSVFSFLTYGGPFNISCARTAEDVLLSDSLSVPTVNKITGHNPFLRFSLSPSVGNSSFLSSDGIVNSDVTPTLLSEVVYQSSKSDVSVISDESTSQGVMITTTPPKTMSPTPTLDVSSKESFSSFNHKTPLYSQDSSLPRVRLRSSQIRSRYYRGTNEEREERPRSSYSVASNSEGSVQSHTQPRSSYNVASNSEESVRSRIHSSYPSRSHSRSRSLQRSFHRNNMAYYHFDFPPDHVGDERASAVIRRIRAQESNLLDSIQSKIVNETSYYNQLLHAVTDQTVRIDDFSKQMRLKEMQHTNSSCVICPASTPFSINRSSPGKRSVLRKFVGNTEVFTIYSKDRMHFANPKSGYDVTLVSVATPDRLFMLSHLLSRWEGPVVVTIFCTFEKQGPVMKLLRKNVLPERLTLILYLVNDSYRDFPINYLRTLGIYNIQTTHFIVIDIDLSVPYNFYSEVQRIPTSVLSNRKAAIILPVFFYFRKVISRNFDSIEKCFDFGLAIQPETKRELLGCLNSGLCRWRKQWFRTHVYTLPQWFKLSQSAVSRVVCLTMDFQEPYMILPFYRDAIIFDDRFANYGYNKVQLYEHVRAAEYTFYILNNVFAMDLPHADSKARTKYKYGGSQVVRRTYQRFQKELVLQYGLNRNLEWCPVDNTRFYAKL